MTPDRLTDEELDDIRDAPALPGGMPQMEMVPMRRGHRQRLVAEVRAHRAAEADLLRVTQRPSMAEFLRRLRAAGAGELLGDAPDPEPKP